MSASSALRVSLFGLPVVECNHQPILFPTRKSKSLFAFLLLHPESHPREQLAAMFWGESTDEQALHSLRTALTALHKALGDIFFADRETVRLNADCALSVDVREFENAVTENPARAVELYQGELLAEFYDDWILRERERLRALYLDALLRLVQTHRAKGDYAEAIVLAQRVLASDPANEVAHQHLMFCYLASGDRSAGLAQYEKCAQALANELNVAPSEETRALYAQIQTTPSESGAARLTNLPHSLTSFVGREKEIRELRELLLHTRLLTLTGVGGSGKTRLAIEVASGLLHANDFAHGVWFVELAPLTDATLVAQTVAGVLGLREEGGRPILDGLRYFLRSKQMLLLLDNCEHLIDACAELAGSLLSEAPQLKILATSREALGIAGENIFLVPSLTLPALGETSPEALTQAEAAHLFITRAMAAQPAFQVTNENAGAVAQICVRLDGIPLALELAAARVKGLSVQEIAAHLDDRFRLLTGGSRTALPRQRTLQATMDWSYRLLSEQERLLVQRVSVFMGGWTLDAAESICADDALPRAEILDLLLHLVDKSLVVAETQATETRYSLLETIRQYAQEKLDETNQAVSLRDRHLDYFLKLGEQAEPELNIGDPKWIACIERDYGNFRAALEHSIGRDAAMAVRLGITLDYFWDFSNRGQESYTWAKRILEATESREPDTIRAKALLLVGNRGITGDLEASRRWLEEALVLAHNLGDKYLKQQAVHSMVVLYYHQRNWTEMLRFAEKNLALSQELDYIRGISDANWQWGRALMGEGKLAAARSFFERSLEISRRGEFPNDISFNLGSLAFIARVEGDYTAAERMLRECVDIRRQMRHRTNLAVSLMDLGQVRLHAEDASEAHELFKESMSLGRELEDRELRAEALWGFAGVAGAAHRYSLAARLFGAAEALTQAMDSPMPPLAHMVYDPIIESARSQLGGSKFDALWAEGRAMSLEQATALALEENTAA